MKVHVSAAILVAVGIFAPCVLRAQPESDANYNIVGRISGPDGGWDYANVDPVHGRLYVVRSKAVMAVDLATGTVTPRLAGAEHGHQVLPLPGSDTVLETNGDSNVARLIEGRTGALEAEIPTGRKPDAAFPDPATHQIAVMNAGDGTVTLIDPVARKATGTITVGGGLEFGVADGKGGAYVNVEDRNAIAVLDLRARRVTRTIALTGCEGPTGLALVNGGTRLISACANGKAVVADPGTGKVVATLAIGRDPDAVLVDARRQRAFIPCGGTGTLSVIDIANPARIRVIGTVATQVGARTGALDPSDGRIYLPTATLQAPAPGVKRGLPVPGTFVVLVLAPRV